jgi:hypothetical protein
MGPRNEKIQLRKYSWLTQNVANGYTTRAKHNQNFTNRKITAINFILMIEMLHLKQFEGSPPYMLEGTSERICKRKQSCVWNVQLYSSAENEKKRQYIYYTKPNAETKLGIWNSTYMYTIPKYEYKLIS